MSTFEVLQRRKRKLLKFQEAIPGSVVGYEYVQKQRPFLFEDDWFFQDTIPVKQARFILQLPSGWEYSASWINYSEQKPQVSGNRYVWEISDVPPIDKELDMPAWQAIGRAPRRQVFSARSGDAGADHGLMERPRLVV